MTNTIIGRWELAAADDVYIGNGRGTNIDGKTFKVRRLTILVSIHIYRKLSYLLVIKSALSFTLLLSRITGFMTNYGEVTIVRYITPKMT